MIQSSKNLSLRIAAAMYTLIAMSPLAFAQGIFGPVPEVNPNNGDDVRTIVLNILLAVLNIMALVAVVFIVVAGIRLVVSGGEDTEKDKAKKTILYVVIGLIVILLAQAIVSFIAIEVSGVE
jgi:type IV secretory pathway VirB2 component (pilin)